MVLLSIQPIFDLSFKFEKLKKKLILKKFHDGDHVDQNLYIFFLKFFYAEKQCGRQFWNAVEREPVKLESSILPRAKLNLNNILFSLISQ